MSVRSMRAFASVFLFTHAIVAEATTVVPPDQVDIRPRSLDLTSPPLKPVETTFVVRWRGERAVHVTAAVPRDPLLQTELSEHTPGRIYVVNVRVPAGYTSPGMGSAIQLKTDTAEVSLPEIQIRVSAKPVQPVDSTFPGPMRLIGKLAPAGS